MYDKNVLTDNGVDVDKSLELFGDMETYNETLEEFLNGVNEKLGNLKKYKEASDMANYAIYAHSLKSDARYLGFTKLAELALDHEMKGKANDADYVFNNYDYLIAEANKMIDVATKYLGVTPIEKVEVINNTKAPLNSDAILVVDDSDMIRNFISRIFDNEFEIIMAHDGREAIDIVTTSTKKIRGVLLDLNMPNISGFEVLKYFNENNLFNKFPVSIITGADDKESVNEAFKYPIIDMLRKPFNERDVKRVVEKTIMFS